MACSLLCPRVFSNPNSIKDPQLFERVHISDVLSLLSDLELFDKSFVAKDTIHRYKSNAPWDKSGDPRWSKYLQDWKLAVFQKIDKLKTIKDVVPGWSHPCLGTSFFGGQEIQEWGYILTCRENFTTDNCCVLVQDEMQCGNQCSNLMVIFKNAIRQNHRLVDFPWLADYDDRLPTAGDEPFIPPRNWSHSTPRRGPNSGYLDDKGREWIHDTERRDHWDVQLDNGGHLNVSYSGKII